MKIITKSSFLPDPDHARKLANGSDRLLCKDSSPYHWNDLRSLEKRNTELQEAIFSDLLGEPVELMDNGVRKFNIAINNPLNAVHIHHDDCDYIGIVYLNEPEEGDGTVIVTHKETGIYYKDEAQFGSEYTNEGDYTSDSFNLDKWKVDIFVPMEYNKLLVFEPGYYHSGTRTFGETVEEGRCVEVWHMRRKNEMD